MNSENSKHKIVKPKFELGGMIDSDKTGRGFLGRIDDLEDEFNNEPSGKQSITEQKADIIDQTLAHGQKLLDTDLLPAIMRDDNAKLIHPYLSEFAHMNLYKLGWRIQFGTSKRWAGLCSAEDHKSVELGHKAVDRNIYISIDFVKHATDWVDKRMDETILHEMSHAVVFEVFYFKKQSSILKEIDPQNNSTEGHGKAWSAVCHAISGQICDRFYSNAVMAESFMNYKYVCDNCGNEKYGNTAQFSNRCSKCGKSVIIEANDD